MIRVLVVDDQALIRQAVTDILSGADDLEVVGERDQVGTDLVGSVAVDTLWF